MKALSLLPRSGIQVSFDRPVVARPSRTLRMHVLRPRGRQTLPAVAYIFGGGWESGNIDQGLLGMAFVAMRGYVAVCIDYRLSSEATFPAQLQDCEAAIRYLRKQSDRLGLDASRIGVGGVSAGGHLAALLGTMSGSSGAHGRSEGDSDVQAVAAWCPPTDLLQLARQHGDSQSHETMYARLLGGPPATIPDAAERANPATYASAGCPPFLLVHGGKDRLVPPAQSELLAAALRRVGARCELLVLPRRGHGFLGFEALRRTIAFFDRELKHGRARR